MRNLKPIPTAATSGESRAPARPLPAVEPGLDVPGTASGTNMPQRSSSQRTEPGMTTWRASRRYSLVVTVLMALATIWVPAVARAGGITVFAAASLTDALADVGHAYEKQSGNTVHFSFAASSTLARQIALGAPADIYISADVRWMDYVQHKDRIVTASRIDLLANQLVLVAPRGSAITRVDIRTGFPLAKLLGGGHLAMGNPMHVPAGIYGKQALTSLKVWPSVKDHVARSANVRAALALVALGDAPLGIVYRTGAMASDKVKIVGTFPAASHKPIVYPAALVRHTGPAGKAARDFLHFMTSRQAGRIFARYGFKVLD